MRLESMRPRDPEEPYRAATPLELFFDLAYVVAIAQAGAALHHAEAEGHFFAGISGYRIRAHRRQRLRAVFHAGYRRPPGIAGDRPDQVQSSGARLTAPVPAPLTPTVKAPGEP